MHVIFWRHAEADDIDAASGTAADLQRELTRQGRRDASRMAAWIKAHVPKPWTVCASPALRTRQTAMALVDYPRDEPALAPGRDVDALLRLIDAARASDSALVLCGHQPTLGRAALRWLSGCDAEFSVRKGALLWIVERERDGQPQRTLRAAISPDLVD